MLIKNSSLFLLFFWVFSCGMPMGNRIDAKNLKVYYLEGVTKTEAVEFTKYWRDNGYIGEKEQTIQLDRDNNGIILIKLIENETYQDESITINELSLLHELQRNLEKFVFKEEVSILITDNRFMPLEKISD